MRSEKKFLLHVTIILFFSDGLWRWLIWPSFYHMTDVEREEEKKKEEKKEEEKEEEKENDFDEKREDEREKKREKKREKENEEYLPCCI